MANNDFKMLLGFVIDRSSLSDIEKELAKKKISINTDLDLKNFAKSKQEVTKQTEWLRRELQKTLSDLKISISDKELTSWTKEYYSQITSEAKKAYSELKSFQKKNMNAIDFEIQKKEEASKRNSAMLKEQMQSAQKLQDQADKIRNNFDSQIQKMQTDLGKIGVPTDEAKTILKDVNDVFAGLNTNGNQSLIDGASKLKSEFDKANVSITQIKKSYSELNSIQNQADKARRNIYIEDYETKIKKAKAELEKLGVPADEITAKLKGINDAFASLDKSSDNQTLVTSAEKFELELDKVKNKITQAKTEYDKLNAPADSGKQAAMIVRLNNYLSKNTAITAESKAQIQQWINTLSGASVAERTLENIKIEFSQIDANMRSMNRLGKSFTDRIKEQAAKFSQWVSVSSVVLFGVEKAKKSIAELKEIDNILTEISKTSDLTKKDLQELGSTSFESASKFGKKASDYLTGVQEMSRSGFYGEKGSAMAEQSLLAQAAGDMSAELANKYILATNAAYKLNGEAERLNGILDGQNNITNRSSVAMEDMAEIISEAGSVAANYRVSIEELSAMGGTIETVTKAGGNEVGNSIKSLLINLQNVSSSEIVNTLNEADASMTQFVNGTEKLRTPIEILRDLSETFQTLDADDPLKAEILTNVGGKYQANALAAILSNMDMYDKMLQDYAEGSGSAMEEAMKSANNWEGSLNKLSNTWTSTVENIVNSDVMITGINIFNEFLGIINEVTSALGGLNTISLGGGLFASAKNFGGAN